MFTPSRLTLARKRRGLTKKNLAERVRVTSRSITAYEAGDIQPSPQAIGRLAEALRFPTGFFEAPDLDEIAPAAASFRSMKKMTASQRDAALGAGELAFIFHDWISARFDLPPAAVPTLGAGIDPEMAAEIVRAEWELGESPIPNMVHLLEARGVRVFSLAEECAEVDAFSLWRSSTPFVFLNTQKSGEHSRFDAAHELGHLVMHGGVESPSGKEAEHEAHRFASAFLMPRARLVASAPRWPSLADLVSLKRPWKVSVASLNYRLHQLGVMSDWHYRNLWIEIGKRGYRTTEPEPIQGESSQILMKVFAALRKEGIGKADIARDLDLIPDELDDFVFGLAMLPLLGDGESTARPDGSRLRVLNGGRE